MKRSYYLLNEHENEDDALICGLCKKILSQPIPLSCGHSICKGCIPTQAQSTLNNLRNSIIRCKICNLVNSFDLLNAKISKSADLLVSVKLNEYFSELKQNFQISLNKYNGLNKN